MKFIDLQKQQDQHHPDGGVLKNKIIDNITKVINHGQFILGPEVTEIEEILSDYVGVKYCISTSSGTDALLISLMALDIQPGDEVITTPFSFIATAETITLLGAIPIYADINPKTYNIDPNQIEALITEKTKAIIAVSLYGQTANMKEINEIANKHGLKVIEDAAQSFGATHHQLKSCGLSTIGTTSFFPSKPFGCYGDGGACFTNDKNLAQRIRAISIHGQVERYLHKEIGLNGRLDTIQAAVLLAKWGIFEKEIKLRQEVANLYTTKLNSIGINSTPYIDTYNTSVYAQYTIKVKQRSEVISILKESGIPSAVHYPIPLCQQPALNNNKSPQSNGTHINALTASNEVISLPMYPYLTEENINRIISSLKDAIKLD